jgi:predicted transposase/invertase (TIGR01784 family)
MVEIEGISYQVIDGKLYRYADLTLDKGFKIVLGRTGSEDILKNLLNRLLDIRITHLEYRSNEYPGMTEEDRASRFDVYCRDEKGASFIVEMQNWSQKYFNKRAVYYSSLAVQTQAVEEYRRQKEQLQKVWDYDFRPTYVVSFLNYRNWTFDGCERRNNEYVATYRYRDVETGYELNDGTTLVFIDIERFNKTIETCDNLEDMWLYSIKNMSKQSACPDSVAGTEVEELFRQAELAKMTNEQRTSFELGVMSRNDMLNSFQETLEIEKEKVKAEAKKIGMAEGLAEGRAEERAAIIGLMSANGMDDESISKILAMNLEDVKRITGRTATDK